MKRTFTIESIEVSFEEDDFEQGCIGTRFYRQSDELHLRFDSLSDAIEQLAEDYSLSKDRANWHINASNGKKMVFLETNQLENEDCEAVKQDSKEYAAWKKGKFTLYAVDYCFRITCEKIEPAEITKDDCKLIGIEFSA